ncbi:MAG: tetratricopeptide repeat protein [Deltaproteobacteria bacterium]|nr:tetratricopeptide repeat protein [Deltaproteobacteria bacterium]
MPLHLATARRSLWTWLLGCVLASSWCAPVQGQVPLASAQLIERLAKQAKRALEDGDHERAAELYIGAWQQDPRQAALLFNAARALHLGRRLDRAEELYRRFVALSGADPELKRRSLAYLAEIALARADERAAEAQRLGQLGRAVEAAAAWRDAFRLAPSRPSYLLRAARAQRLSQQPLLARADYRAYLAVAPPGQEREEAERELALLEAESPADPVPLPTAPTATQRAPAAVVPAPPPPSEPRPSPWSWSAGIAQSYLTGTGAAGAGVAGEFELGVAFSQDLLALAWLTGGLQLAGNGARTFGGGEGVRSDIDVAAVALGLEVAAARATGFVGCSGGWCEREANPQTVLRARVRADWPWSRSSGVFAVVTTGFGVETWYNQVGFAIGCAFGQRAGR